MNISKVKFLIAQSASLVLIAGCSVSPNDQISSDPIVIGVGQCCEVLDPANTYTPADWVYLMQLYPSLFNAVPGSDELVNDLADSAEWINPTTLRVVVKEGLTFSNGNLLTASDVVFSLTRQINIASQTGPSPLWNNIDSVTLIDGQTLEIVTKVPNDVTLKKVLSSIYGLIVDEEVFSFDRVMENEEILAAKSFAGPYILEAIETGSFLSLIPNPNYSGVWGAPLNSGVIVRSYQETMNLVADFKSGAIDGIVAYQKSLTPDVFNLASEGLAEIYPSPTVQAISMFVNHTNIPYGSGSDVPSEEKAQAIRTALSLLIDRDQLVDQAYFGVYRPMHSAIPADFQYSISDEIALSLSGNDRNLADAEALLRQKDVAIPVSLELLMSSSRWGEASLRLATLLKSQLEQGGLFSISVSDVDWTERQDRRRAGNYELMLNMWGADFADADNYLTPMVVTDSRFNTGYSNSRVDVLVVEQAAALTSEQRQELLGELQEILSKDLPFIPLISGGPTFIAQSDLKNGDIFVNREHKYLFSFLSR